MNVVMDVKRNILKGVLIANKLNMKKNKKYECYFYDDGCCLSYPHMITLFKKECDQKLNQHRCLFYKENIKQEKKQNEYI